MRRLAVVLLIALSASAGAQRPRQRPVARPTRPTMRPEMDSAARRDTTKKDTAFVDWAPADSVMQALGARQGYTTTRYQGKTATFEPQSKVLDLLAPDSGKAAVQRGTQTFVSDSGIFYNDTKRQAVLGGHYLVSDPSTGQADIKGFGLASYNLAERFARVPNARFAVNNGNMWYMTANDAAIAGDSTAKQSPTIFMRGGTITSCEDSIPDYHFEFGEAKRTSTNTIVARPAVLYIKDIPVAYLPFIFSDTRSGRHSGILPPRFGIGDIVRSSGSYRRNIENFGYYWALNDYMDASAWLDWRSSAGGNSTDPGWARFNGEWQYKWLDRRLMGRLASAYTAQRDGHTNLALSWSHNQDFTSDSKLNTSINYVTSTTLQRQNTFDPYSVLATIYSSASYTNKIGPASLSLGGTRKQYPGRKQVEQGLPTLSLTTGPLNVANWLTWTPSFSYNASQTLHMDQPGVGAFNYFTNPAGQRDSSASNRSAYQSDLQFDTPLQIFGYDLRNSFHVQQMRNNFPEEKPLLDVRTGEVKERRLYTATYRTSIDWTPNFSLPALARNMFNLTPGVSLENVDPGPFWVKTEQSNGLLVHQSKRPSFSLSANPTIFGLIPGFGPFTRLRHSISPTFGFSFAPKANVSDEYLQATGQTRAHYLGALQQSAVSFGLSTNLEAKVRNRTDTNPDNSDKLKILTLQMSPFAYDFERAKQVHRAIAGLTTQSFNYSVRSDLLPGFEFSSSYSLFQGSTLSDTAKFSPYRENVQASLNISQSENPFAVLTRLFGKAVPEAQVSPLPAKEQIQPSADDEMARRLAAQPVAGREAHGQRLLVPSGRAWRASFSFSSARPRPPTGSHVIEFDPRKVCEQQAQGAGGLNSFVYELCLQQQQSQPSIVSPIPSTTANGQAYHIPGTSSLSSNINFGLTEKWTAAWNTSYDLVRHQFAMHQVQLQRDLHDWNAIFAFTQSPNGNFAFSFGISLKAEPDLKFDYNRTTVRSGSSF